LSKQIFKIFALLESIRNLLQNPYDITHLTIGIISTLPCEIKNSIFCRCGRKHKQIAFSVVTNFVIHPQIFIFSGFKIASLSPYWLQIKFSMSVFFYLFTFAISLWHQKFVTADITAVFVNNQHGIQQRGQDFNKKSLYLKGYTANRLTDEFPEKSWTKRGVNSCWKSCGTQAQLTGGQAAADRTVKRMPNISNILLTHRCTNAICLHFLPYLLNICRNIWIFNFPR